MRLWDLGAAALLAVGFFASAAADPFKPAPRLNRPGVSVVAGFSIALAGSR